MANTFKNITFRGGSTAADALTNVGDFGGASNAVATGSQVTLIGMTIANITSGVIAVGVKIINASNQTWIIKDAPIPTGGSLVVLGGDQKVCLQFGPSVGDTLSVISNTANSMDVVISYLEIT
tara:strand:+ start:1788 stop:2156 length:369 start_codon:yes stop_codon:yes gene_type:complete